VNAVASAGLDRHGNLISRVPAVPLRLGIEGRAGALGLELGMLAIAFDGCATGATAGVGPYGAARVYLPLGDSRGHLVVEAGGYYIRTPTADCTQMRGAFESTTLTEYAGYAGLGVEWPL
jgi:hypothetical protein